MAFNAKGPSGVVKVGGRQAASLGRWELTSQGGGLFTCEAQVMASDEYLLSMPDTVRKELQLHVGNKVHAYRDVRVGGMGDSCTISGKGPMEVRDR